MSAETQFEDSGSGPDCLPPEIISGEALLRADIYSSGQMAAHARRLAAWHRVSVGSRSSPLLRRLEENNTALSKVIDSLRATPELALLPAAEWLLDNRYLILEQILTIRSHLPRGYSRELPRLQVGEPQGMPRVYGLALEYIAHGDAHVDAEGIAHFVGAYVQSASLTLGELWAVPIMLRLALIENLRRIAARVDAAQCQRQAAAVWAERFVQAVEGNPSMLVIELAELAAGNGLNPAFVGELQRRLLGQHPGVGLVLQWLEQRLGERQQTVADLVRLDHQDQAADRIAVANAITSLRSMNAIDWKAFVEGISPVEEILRQDPAGVYAAMDFATRDDYRHQVEALARRCRGPRAAAQQACAAAAIALASGAQAQVSATAAADPDQPPLGHVGWWLMAGGRLELERRLAREQGLRQPRGREPVPLAGYLLPLLLLALVITAAVVVAAGGLLLSAFAILGLGLLLLPAAAQAARSVVDWVSTRLVAPRRLPRLDFSLGIPSAWRTAVAVPALMGSNEECDHLLEGLEVRALANEDDHLVYVLLSDFPDAAQQNLASDGPLLAHAQAALKALNDRHRRVGSADRFLILHRDRRWNPQEGLWMGAERKRGKIEALNRLLLQGASNAELGLGGPGEGKPAALASDAELGLGGPREDTFTTIMGNAAGLYGVSLVLVLDADTRLPRDGARHLIEAMAHPLNRPRLDPASGVVVAGHGVLQPRAAVSLTSARRSRYAMLWSSDAGIDPYTRAVADIYQDLFSQGSFVGKGLYDLRAFAAALNQRFPDNAILSHDLIEGSFARAALVSDVVVVEDHPASYLADLNRRLRWLRGDWQLLPWLLPRIPSASGWAASPLDGLARWKILDNLQRSLLAPATLAALLLGWALLPPGGAWALSLAVALLALVPVLLGAAAGLDGETRLRGRLRRVGRGLVDGCLVAGTSLAFLPGEALRCLDAIARTCWRLLVSRRHLLRWQTASEGERLAARSLGAMTLAMLPSPLLGLATLLWVLFNPIMAPALLPFALLWIGAPALAWWLAAPPKDASAAPLSAADRHYLLCSARHAWEYFADLVGPQTHWLPPDNIQLEPRRVVAMRTSPTNMGLALLSDLSAHDHGWLTSNEFLNRIEHELEAIAGLEHYRGHCYNWYDIASARPLAPRYISTVDSGNLAGHLLVLAAGLREMAEMPLSRRKGLLATAITVDLAGRMAPPSHRSVLSALAKQLRGEGGCSDSAINAAIALLSRMSSEDPESELTRWTSAAARELSAQQECWAALRAPQGSTTLQQLAQEPERHAARAMISRSQRLASQARAFAMGMEWNFLLNPGSKLFSTGYHLDDARLDRSTYDLLASENRLTSFIAVASGQIEQEHWFRLGRPLLPTAAGPVLGSWSGTMFEYLMPLLVMPEEAGSLLHASAQAAVAEQQRYAQARGIPWGISESAYYATDSDLNWQYRAFGVPGLSLNRNLYGDPVVAPYASALALLVDPQAALRNLRRLESLDTNGIYGLHEALDYTSARLPIGDDMAVIPSWMAHHQGMTLVACTQVLLEAPMHRRFLADRRLQAHRLLLQERPVLGEDLNLLPESDSDVPRPEWQPSLYVVNDPSTAPPQVQLLSNGRYHVMVTASGSGYSRWGDIALTRWREDSSRDHWGQACYLRDCDSGAVWSTTWQPLGSAAAPSHESDYEAVFTQARAEFRRVDDGIAAHTDLTVSPEDDVEIRRLTLTNRSAYGRDIEITTYAEPVLAPAAADQAHPAFAKLSVQTEAAADHDALIATRRPRHAGEARVWLAHALIARDGEAGPLSWDSDREGFLGRNQSTSLPQALIGDPGPLAGRVGAVLDPALALRRVVHIPPGSHITIDLISAVAASREALISLCDRYRDPNLAERAFDLSRTHAQVVLSQLGATDADAQVFARLAGPLLYASSQYRAADLAIRRNASPRRELWRYGISGDLPICLVRVSDAQRLDSVALLLRAHAWWRAKGLAVDVVILIEDPSHYRQELSERVLGIIASSPDAGQVDRPGGVFVRRSEQISEADRYLFVAVARLLIRDSSASLSSYTSRRAVDDANAPRRPAPRWASEAPSGPHRNYDLLFWNGLGGFTADGREYIIILAPGISTPAPWCNVLANESFGTVISERGAAYTWAINCHEFRLSPWHCDAVADPHSEAFYIRDEDSGAHWCPTPGPMAARGHRVIRHGFGYSVFSAEEESIASELHVWVDREAPVKHAKLRLENRSKRPRRLSMTAYVEWTLAELRERSAMHLVTSHQDGILSAVNPMHDDHGSHTAFLCASQRASAWTCDRREFLGRLGSPAAPAAMAATTLLGRCGAGLDPCAALTVEIHLKPGESHEVVFTLGAAADAQQAQALALTQRSLDRSRDSLNQIYGHWRHILGQVQVHSPDPALDILANGWLPYQVYAARILARSGFSQSGGAYGFRDQLQDCMAMVHHDPQLLRDQIIRAAGRQYPEGDVQHWWHPPSGRGVRTHISDDLLWLPYAVAHSIAHSGDSALLDQQAPWLQGDPVPAEDESRYDLPQISDHSSSIYDHAVAAIRHSLSRRGQHGLPLIGGGDWNDGMNQIGHEGRGESVWLAFFLCDVLKNFVPLIQARGDQALADEWTAAREAMEAAISQHAWDGQWYLRAWYDNGNTLGSAADEECRIDALPQSWSAITGIGSPERAQAAMQQVDQQLVRRDDGLIQLFDPPFDQGEAQPGYIKGYLPGVRENGGQYTHAAVWTAMAFAALGNAPKALELSRLINPILHADSPTAAARWRVEPYVMAADVYRSPAHLGRGGWTWYTGSAGWMWRLLVESLLGYQRQGNKVRLHPCTPKDWGDHSLTITHGTSTWTLSTTGQGQELEQELGQVLVDGKAGLADAEGWVEMIDDGGEHWVGVGR